MAETRMATVPLSPMTQLLDSQKRAVMPMLSKLLTPELFFQAFTIALWKTPELEQCSVESFIVSLYRSARSGLPPDGVLAYLLPYNGACTLVPDYRGFEYLARRTPNVIDLHSHLVYAKDVFRLRHCTAVPIEHESYTGPDRGDIIGGYTFVQMESGFPKVEYLNIDDLEKIRRAACAKYKNPESPSLPWNAWREEMYRKCPIRRVAKHLDQLPEMQEALGAANDLDAGIIRSLSETIRLPQQVIERPPPPKSAADRATQRLDKRDEQKASIKTDTKGIVELPPGVIAYENGSDLEAAVHRVDALDPVPISPAQKYRIEIVALFKRMTPAQQKLYLQDAGYIEVIGDLEGLDDLSELGDLHRRASRMLSQPVAKRTGKGGQGELIDTKNPAV